jgi:hypothetical protein
LKLDAAAGHPRSRVMTAEVEALLPFTDAKV